MLLEVVLKSSRKMELTAFVDKVAKNKTAEQVLWLKNIKDGETRLEASISTLQNPYQLKIVSTRTRLDQKEFNHSRPSARKATLLHLASSSLSLSSMDQWLMAKTILQRSSKAGVSFLKYDLNLTFKKNPSVLNMGLNSQFDVNEASLFYPLFCNYGSGCSSKGRLTLAFLVDMVNKECTYQQVWYPCQPFERWWEGCWSWSFHQASSIQFILKAPYVFQDDWTNLCGSWG